MRPARALHFNLHEHMAKTFLTLLPASELRHLPGAITAALLRRLTPTGLETRPWWSLGMRRRIESILRPDMRVLEFGAGPSTVWLAERVDFVVSVERDPAWAAYARWECARRGLANLHMLVRDAAKYADCSDFADGAFDLAVIAGSELGEGAAASCVGQAWPKVKPGGWIYLADADADGAGPGSAEAFLRSVCADGDVIEHTGLVIGALAARRGLLCRVPT